MEDNRIYLISTNPAYASSEVMDFYARGYDNAKKYIEKLKEEGYCIPFMLMEVHIGKDGVFTVFDDEGETL